MKFLIVKREEKLVLSYFTTFYVKSFETTKKIDKIFRIFIEGSFEFTAQ